MKLIRAITGFVSGLCGFDNLSLNLPDIRRNLILIGVQRMKELIDFLESRNDELDYQRFKGDLSDLTLSMGQFSDFMPEVERDPAEIRQLQNQIR